MSADLFFQIRRIQLVALAARYKVPTMYEWPEFIAVGGLVSYSTARTDSMHQLGIYVGRILNGAKPADLPVAQSIRFERHQPQNRQGTWSHNPALPACPRRRGDRVRMLFAAMHGSAVSTNAKC
jgi:hypothetical protein